MSRIARAALASLLLVAGLLSANGQVLAQTPTAADAAGKRFDLQQPGAQTIALGKFSYDAQKSGLAAFKITLEKGDATATLVLRMLSPEGSDLAPEQKLLGWRDPTREVALKELKAGSPLQVNEDFVTPSGAAAVSVELKVDVTKAPCVLRVEGLAIRERKGEIVVEEDGGVLVTQPEQGFKYATNLVPPLDSPKWEAIGDGAKRGVGPAGQPVLLIDEKIDGRWESPVVPLDPGAVEICLQSFVKYDAMATPYENPLRIQFRDAQGKLVQSEQPAQGWPIWTWRHLNGQWLPLSVRVARPDGAVSAQLVVKLGKGISPAWQPTKEVTRNNFVVLQMAGIKLWSTAKASTALAAPYNFTAFAGGTAGAGPFTPCTPRQQNSIALTTHVNDLANLQFSKERRWPAPRAWMENYLPIERTVELKGEMFDWMGQPCGSVVQSVSLKPFETKDVELAIKPIERAGIYSINLNAMQEGAAVGQGVIRWSCLTEPNNRADRRHELYSFWFHPGFSGQGADHNNMTDLECRTLLAMGVRGFRLQVRLWGLDGTDVEKAIEHVRKFSDRFHKEVLPYMQKYGFDGYITFFPKPRSIAPAVGTPEMEAWKKYVAAAVKLYPECSTFTFGNEEVGRRNKTLDTVHETWGYTGTMRDFTREFLAAHEAALEARPEIKFVLGQASDPTANVGKLFFEAGGTPKDVQGWAINSYGNAPATWRNLSDTLTRNGVDVSKLVGIIPEIGYGAQRRGPGRLPAERSEVIQMVCNHVDTLAVAPWVHNITWFITFPHSPKVGNFFYDVDWSPKPMAGAYITMSSTLGAGRPKRIAELPKVNAYLWERPDGTKAGVVWAAGRQRLRLKVGETSGAVTVRDVMGNDIQVSSERGVITVEVSQVPVYLLDIQSLSDGSEISSTWNLEQTSDNQRLAKVEIRNRLDKPLDISGHFEDLPAVTWSRPEIPAFRLAPGESKVVSAAFTLAGKVFSADLKTLTLMLKINGTEVASDFATTLLTARRAVTTPGQDGKGWEIADTAVSNRANQVTSRGTPRWKGPDDLSGQFRVLWDDQYMYFRAEVKDDTDVHLADPDNMFMNDNIQIGIATESTEKVTGGIELSLGMSEGRPVVQRRTSTTVELADAETVRLNVTRDESTKTTVYGAAIAWKALNIAEPKAGLHLRFAILVNDSDQASPDGQDRQGLQWFSGIFEKAISRYGDVTLCD